MPSKRGAELALILTSWISALVDSDELVRVAAAEALDVPRSRKAATALRKAFRDRIPTRAQLRSGCVRAHRLPNRPSALEARVGQSSHPMACDWASWKDSGWLGDRDAFDEALHLVNSSDYRVRCATAAALAGTFLSRPTRPWLIVTALVERLAVEETRAARSSVAFLSALSTLQRSASIKRLG